MSGQIRTVAVAGGGWAGCAAAVSAKRALGPAGRVVLVERTDMLLGLGLCGGIFRNNGRFPAAEEALALGGGGNLVRVMDGTSRHCGVEFPGHSHASLYDVNLIEPAARELLAREGVEVMAPARVTEVRRSRNRLQALVTADGDEVAADAFVDATGTAGPPGNCILHGNGCAMCVIRCPSFGPRRGLTELAGIEELTANRDDGSLGSFSGSCDLRRETISPVLRARLDATGVAVLPIPAELRDRGKLANKACQQYNLPEFESGLVLLDTGPVKMMSPYFPLADLRRIPGMAGVRYEEPSAGGIGNSVRFIGLAPHGRDLRVSGTGNLFCAGEKAGPQVGHTEAIITGALAGYNAARAATGLGPVTLPDTLAAGDFVACLSRIIRKRDMGRRITFAGAWFFERMKERKTYTLDIAEIRGRVARAGLEGVFDRRLL